MLQLKLGTRNQCKNQKHDQSDELKHYPDPTSHSTMNIKAPSHPNISLLFLDRTLFFHNFRKQVQLPKLSQ